jgi:uncharacterized protein with von Willebrand factor type A (vWA) domain
MPSTLDVNQNSVKAVGAETGLMSSSTSKDLDNLKQRLQPSFSGLMNPNYPPSQPGGGLSYYSSLELIEKLVSFAKLLRDHGIKCSPAEVVEAFNAISLLGDGSLETLRVALRLTLVKRVEDYRTFDSLFNTFWSSERMDFPRPKTSVRVVVEGEIDAVSRFLSMYSPLEVVWRESFKPITSLHRARSIGSSLRAYRRILSLQYGRRRVRSTKGFIDFRRSMKASLRTFGEIVKLVKTRRKKNRAKLAVLLDVSGSMRDHWGLVIDVLRALRSLPSGSYKALIFSTRLADVTSIVSSTGDLEGVVGSVLKEFSVWGSGTRIGEALQRLLKVTRLDKSWCLMILSDGWDLGDLRILEESLKTLKSITGHMVWVTPYNPEGGFKPATACLRIALGYVDKLLPSTSLENPGILKRYYRL